MNLALTVYMASLSAEMSSLCDGWPLESCAACWIEAELSLLLSFV